MTIQPPIMQNKARQSNFELLRILAMVAIIANHFSLHSGFAFAPGDLSLQRFYVQLLQLGGKVGVNLFVMISGYFLIHTTSIKLSKILKLWGQVIFYSVTILRCCGSRAMQIEVSSSWSSMRCPSPSKYGGLPACTSYCIWSAPI